LLLGSQCSPSPTTGTAYQILELGPFTVVTTHNPDGSVSTADVNEPGLVGLKKVGFQFNAFEPLTLQSVTTSYWPAGQKVAQRSIQDLPNRSVTPSQGGVGLAFTHVLPVDTVGHM
jgi:hypothetical protein